MIAQNPGVRRRIWERDGGICGICNRSVTFDRNMHLDHITPVSWGGADTEDNLRPSHGECNTSRGGRMRSPNSVIDHAEGAVLRFMLRIPDDMYADLRARADAEGRSLHNLIMWILRRAVNERGIK